MSSGRAEWSTVQTYELPGMRILQFPCLNDNYGYLVEHGEHVLAVDVPESCGLEYCQRSAETFAGKPISHVLITHWHWDHLGGLPEILTENCKGNQGKRPEIYGSRVELPQMLKYAKESDFARLLSDGDRLQIGSLDFEIALLPGHTLGHIGYFLSNQKLAFVGDVLFNMGCGRLFEGTPEQAWGSMQRILQIGGTTSDDWMIYCAHEYTTDGCQFALSVDGENTEMLAQIEEVKIRRANRTPTVPFSLGQNKRINPFLRPAQVGKYGKHPERADAAHAGARFAELRSLRNNFKVVKPWPAAL